VSVKKGIWMLRKERMREKRHFMTISVLETSSFVTLGQDTLSCTSSSAELLLQRSHQSTRLNHCSEVQHQSPVNYLRISTWSTTIIDFVSTVIIPSYIGSTISQSVVISGDISPPLTPSNFSLPNISFALNPVIHLLFLATFIRGCVLSLQESLE